MESTVLGDFRLIKRIAKGGMGEVYQAYDTRCRRYVALKKIREDLKNFQGIRKRFLAEAHIAASLTHPSIIPIFTIQAQEDPPYYTMPLLEGQSLKALILQAKQHSQDLSMNKVVSIFLAISQGIAHAHSRGFLHRDIKAENIWMGACDDPLILDWGVAKSVSDVHDETFSEIWAQFAEAESEKAKGSGDSEGADSLDDEGIEAVSSKLISGEGDSDEMQLTRPGKVVGTLSYMAPERALKQHVSYASDIYSLGVLLYFMLTLHLPFRRRSLKEYLKVAKKEGYIDPRQRAPFRDIPKDLVHVVDRCLKFDAAERYLTVQDLIDDLLLFTQAGSDWVQHAELSPLRDKDWIAKEWVYLTTPVAQSEALHPEPMGWVTRMISRASFEGSLKIRMEIKPKEDAGGLGLLLCAPEQESSHRSLDGYCLWIGAEGSPGGQLLRNGVMVLDLPGFCLKPGVSHQLTVECLDNVLHCYFDHAPKTTYVSYLPLIGSHVGLVVAKGHFEFVRLHVFGGKHSLQVSCLAVPDAFLAQKMYRQALSEYRRIGASFFDYLEGRQAIFRAGITLIEWSRQRPEPSGAHELLEMASIEFEKLKGTLSAPLEWLGKSLVYREMGQEQEEMNALELACLRFDKHPLVSWLHEEVVFRLHEHVGGLLKLSCRIVLLIVRALPQFMQRRDIASRVRQILVQLPPTHFWQYPENSDGTTAHGSLATVEGMAIRMGYLLADPKSILDVCRTLLSRNHLSQSTQSRLIQNAIYSLLFMGAQVEAEELLEKMLDYPSLGTRTDLLCAAVKGDWPDLCQERFALLYSEQRLIEWLLEREIRSMMDGRFRPDRVIALVHVVESCELAQEQAEGLLHKLGWTLLYFCAGQGIFRKSEQSPRIDQTMQQYLVRWKASLDSWPLIRALPESQFLEACYLFLMHRPHEGFQLLAKFRQLAPQHPLALLEAWIHRRLLTLKLLDEKALVCEKESFLRHGALLLLAYHPKQQAHYGYQRLVEGLTYATSETNPESVSGGLTDEVCAKPEVTPYTAPDTF